MRSLCLRSRLPSAVEGWTVELDRTEASVGCTCLSNASYIAIFVLCILTVYQPSMTDVRLQHCELLQCTVKTKQLTTTALHSKMFGSSVAVHV